MNALNQVSSALVIVPAYGRNYKTKHEAIDDWKNGKDFKIINGPYMSIRDIKNVSCSSVWIDLITSMVRVE